MTLRFIVSGLDQIFFNDSEVVNVTLICMPQRREQDKLAYIDKLIENNMDVALHKQAPPSNFIPFQEDSEYDEPIDPEDEDDEGDDGEGPVQK
jgi:hypothetical protein